MAKKKERKKKREVGIVNRNLSSAPDTRTEPNSTAIKQKKTPPATCKLPNSFLPLNKASTDLVHT